MSIVSSVKTAVTRNSARSVLKIKKYSPEILITVGIVGFVGAVVLAAKSSVHLEETVRRGTERIEDVKVLATYKDDEDKRVYSDDDIRKDLTVAYIRNATDLTKLYAAPVGLVIASTACILTARGIMKRREVALVAAYNLLAAQMANYRDRVIEKVGVDEERILHSGLKEGVDIENDEVNVLDYDGEYSQYARIFERGATSAWDPYPHYNEAFLVTQEAAANQLLRARGHVFLNDVYDALGFPRTKAGNLVGWVDRDKMTGKKQTDGDNYISFGTVSLARERSSAFVGSGANAFFLDFNVDGIILDLI